MQKPDDNIELFPAKRFFVEMLTRDIDLQDAVLDLLDNCLDGALRSIGKGFDPNNPDAYKDYWAEISITKDSFSIEDNCGGIPVELGRNYAFRMGRPTERNPEDQHTVGVYGIGMKRAIFKMGKNAKICSNSKSGSFEVAITPQWMEDQDNWRLHMDVGPENTQAEQGVRIIIDNLRPNVSRLLSNETGFVDDLIDIIATHYSIIIQKGFVVKVNGVSIIPKKMGILFDEDAFKTGKGFAPFVYKNKIDEVDVVVAVGFYRNPISQEEEDALLDGKSTSDRAGWTIICNDRVVLAADKSLQTGWGEAGVPNYHTQFINIAGFVEFRGDTTKLPLTTTKRGIEGNSTIYLSVKNSMRDGMKVFTSYTNKIKKFGISAENFSLPVSSRKVLSETNVLSSVADVEKWSNMSRSSGQYFKPELPEPKLEKQSKIIRFERNVEDVKLLASELLGDSSALPGKVGEACFDYVLSEVRK